MAASFWKEDNYRHHFFCALCGGPFARVYRAGGIQEEAVDGDGESLTIPAHCNSLVSSSELDADTDDLHRLEQLLQHPGRPTGSAPPQAEVRRAYNGNDINEADMRWTRVLRALIHRSAKEQPVGGLDLLADDQSTYLTYRGKVRESASWADAFVMDHEDQLGFPAFDGQNNFGFHLYQEPDRNDRKFRISSIPFHDECWDLLDHAVRVAGARRGMPEEMSLGEHINLDDLWAFLSSKISVAVTEKLSYLTTEVLRSSAPHDIITRLSPGSLGNAGYREAQQCGNGRKWLHVDGQHWLVTNPSSSPFLCQNIKLPFVPPPSRNSQNRRSRAYTFHRGHDPFSKLPPEIGSLLIGHLTYLETSSLIAVSKAAKSWEILQKEYKRFILEELAYLPNLYISVANYVEPKKPGPRVDWRKLFQRHSTLWQGEPSLRNRRRIWKIVESFADELFERSATNLVDNEGLTEVMAFSTTVVRGELGIMSGAEGYRDMITFIAQAPSNTDSSSSSGATTPPHSSVSSTIPDLITPSDLIQSLKTLLVWSDPGTRSIRGLEFAFEISLIPDGNPLIVKKRFGSRGLRMEKYEPEFPGDITLTGFILCWGAGYLQGVQFVFESSLSAPSEYSQAEALSPRFGWWDYPVRRLVAPRSYRYLAGVRGFINRRGFIETFALLEQVKDNFVIPIDGERPMISIPTSVPLSHREASLWSKLPPNDVDILEREGPAIGDWRLRAAECEVLAPTMQYKPPGLLKYIRGFVQGDYLCGLEFSYKTVNGEIVVNELGNCKGVADQVISITANEQLLAAVVGYGGLGIHSLQIVTSSNKPHPAVGPRYLGFHKIYAVQEVSRQDRERLGHVVYLKSPIIGFHCLYNSDLDRFLQLGIVCYPENFPVQPVVQRATPNSEQESFPQTTITLPFVNTDEHRNPWVDGPPPPNLLRGRKASDLSKSLVVAPNSKYAGWVDFRHQILSITVYGDMQGMRFSFFDQSRPDTIFGSHRGLRGVIVFVSAGNNQNITSILSKKPDISVSSERPLHQLRFSTVGQSMRQTRSLQLEVESELLAGIQFDFTEEKIIDWHPLFDFSAIPNQSPSTLPLYNSNLWISPNLHHQRPTAWMDIGNFPCYQVLLDFFDDNDSDPERRVDGIKGYVSNSRFCGLRFRRQGLWDTEPLGQSSAYETLFLLEPGETFVSLYSSAAPAPGGGPAIALCTNTGRTTPWLGSLLIGAPVLKSAPAGRRATGIYMAFSDPVTCDFIGIIHEADNESTIQTPSLPPPGPPKLPKDNSRAGSPKDLQDSYQSKTSFGSLAGNVSKAYTIFEPDHLEKIESYSNSVQGRFGLKALKLHGDRRSGVLILGDWQDRFAHPTEDQIFPIQGRPPLK
ncbi:MAG: hypothetical protein M1829_001729 [Trizodia sp. TS-e1964]|nr:MAG: hypothetical protein M1829_001729 [Trizodia sp. TS-e1964]